MLQSAVKHLQISEIRFRQTNLPHLLNTHVKSDKPRLAFCNMRETVDCVVNEICSCTVAHILGSLASIEHGTGFRRQAVPKDESIDPSLGLTETVLHTILTRCVYVHSALFHCAALVLDSPLAQPRLLF